jgi:dihydrofolate synthase/folylpolyglutamate synthase
MDALEEKFQQSLDWIYSWVDFSMKRHVDDTHRFFKLDRMHKLMELLNNPHESFPCVHVAGTKGKGSTASFIASALQAAGYKVGLYTSPHLFEFQERIVINGQWISKEDLVSLTDEMRPLTEIVRDATTFELTTALAFLYFQKQKADIAVLEVGLGGRLDATNVVDPLVSVITPVSYDHMAVLGDTLTEIAYEKGGIIKPGKPVVISPQTEEAMNELVRLAKERNSPLISVEKAFDYHESKHSLGMQTIQVQQKEDAFTAKLPGLAAKPLTLNLPLLGRHQMENAVTALAALDEVRRAGFRVSRQAVQRGFKRVVWHARFEILRRKPPVISDSAHNGDSMKRLVETLDEYFPGKPFILIFGASADKELDTMLKIILPRVDAVMVTQSIHPRAANAEELKERLAPYGKPVSAFHRMEEALPAALELAGSQKGIIATGSVFVAAAANVIWTQQHLHPERIEE